MRGILLQSVAIVLLVGGMAGPGLAAGVEPWPAVEQRYPQSSAVVDVTRPPYGAKGDGGDDDCVVGFDHFVDHAVGKRSSSGATRLVPNRPVLPCAGWGRIRRSQHPLGFLVHEEDGVARFVFFTADRIIAESFVSQIDPDRATWEQVVNHVIDFLDSLKATAGVPGVHKARMQKRELFPNQHLFGYHLSVIILRYLSALFVRIITIEFVLQIRHTCLPPLRG